MAYPAVRGTGSLTPTWFSRAVRVSWPASPRSPAVAFAGYSIPHPSKPVLQLRIQTGRSNYLVAPSSDDAMDEETTTSPSAGASVQVESNGVTAADALAQGVLDLTAMLRHIRETFDAELANATMPR